jgi:hypothetical protein
MSASPPRDCCSCSQSSACRRVASSAQLRICFCVASPTLCTPEKQEQQAPVCETHVGGLALPFTCTHAGGLSASHERPHTQMRT